MEPFNVEKLENQYEVRFSKTKTSISLNLQIK